MDVGNITQLTTTNGIGTSGVIGTSEYWLDGMWYPYTPTPSISYWYASPSMEPVECIGRAHVFECDHAKACKCGKVKRSNPARLDKEK